MKSLIDYLLKANTNNILNSTLFISELSELRDKLHIFNSETNHEKKELMFSSVYAKAEYIVEKIKSNSYEGTKNDVKNETD